MAANIRGNLMHLSKDSHTSSGKKAGDEGGAALPTLSLCPTGMPLIPAYPWGT